MIHYKEKIDDNKNKFYRYAAPLYINQSCLACHDNQDYRIDDVRGLISIEFPLEEMENSIASSNKITSYAVIIGLIILIASISFSIYMLVIRHLRTLQKAADAMRLGIREETNIETDDEIEEFLTLMEVVGSPILSTKRTLDPPQD